MKRVVFLLVVYFFAFSQESEVKRVCAWRYSDEAHISVDEDDSESHVTTSQGSETEECKRGIYSCYTLWKEVKQANNSTALVILAQGCWVASRRQDCPGERCEGRQPKAMKRIFCCCSSDMCNLNITSPPLETEGESDPPQSTQLPVLGTSHGRVRLVILVVFGLVLFTTLIAMFAALRRWGPPTKAPLPLSPDHRSLPPPNTPYSLAQLKLDKIVGQGRYGTVWLGTVKDQQVAVKMFPSHYCQYFFNERDLYMLPFMDHPSLLNYFGCEESTNKEGVATLTLVLSYCPNGTLQEYLKANTLDLPLFTKMALSIAAGLAHLHTEIRNGEKWKPCVTHRDVNTRNVLVKGDLSCCLCDLGLGVKITGSHYYTMGGEQHAETKSINDVGTLRYMAPEVLEGAVNLRDCESSLKQIDVYALGLVIWEAASRTVDLYSKSSDLPPYMLPFEKEVGIHPSLERMQTAVCRNKARPMCDWSGGGPGRLIKETVDDCTDQDGEARLTALCVHERLSQLARGCGGTTGVSPTVNVTHCGNATHHQQFPIHNNNNSNCTNNNTDTSEQTDGGVSEGTVETLVTMSPSEPYPQSALYHNTTSVECVQSYQGMNPCLERNLMYWEEPVVVQTSAKHSSTSSSGAETAALLPPHPHPIPYLQNRPFYQGNNGVSSKQCNNSNGGRPLGAMFKRPLRRLLGSGKKGGSGEEGRVIVSPFQEREDHYSPPPVVLKERSSSSKPKESGGVKGEEKKKRPSSLQLSNNDYVEKPLKEISARVKTPGDLPPSVRRKARTDSRARLSLYDDRMMSGGPLDSAF